MQFAGNIRACLVVVILMFSWVTLANAQDAARLKSMAEAYVAAWNSGSAAGLDALVTADFKRHAAPSTQSSVESMDALKKVMAGAHATFPDFKVTIDEVIVTEGRIVMRWTYSGTHSGADNEALAGKKVTNSGISVVHVADGKMVEEWAAWDNLNTMTQLGMTVVPAEQK